MRHLRVALVSGERLRALIGGQPPRSRRAAVALVEGKGRARHGVGVAPPSALGVSGNLVAHRATGAMLRAARVPVAAHRMVARHTVRSLGGDARWA